MSLHPLSYAVVIPTVGRPSLRTLLDALASATGPAPAQIVVVDDRPLSAVEALGPVPGVLVLRSGGRGPAAARNTGWRAVSTDWIAFLDDDVVPGPDWPAQLVADLATLPADVGASQGRIEVPLPANRRPTDAERGTAGLASALWITADMAYRRAALDRVGGFDERFPRAYREDADLALRVIEAGYRVVRGRRLTTHPVRPAGFLASVRAQAGNADNALMRRKHGPDWRARIGSGPGRLGRHALTTLAAAVTLAAALRPRGVLGDAGRPRGVAGAVWAGLTAEFALRRILPGPRTPAEVAKMVVTSVLIPPVACYHRLAGELRWARVRKDRRLGRERPDFGPFGAKTAIMDAARGPGRPAALAVLFDRDGTLVEDVPYNGDASLVRPVAGARAVLDRLRRAGVPVGVVSNQSGVARGLFSEEQLAEVNARVEELLGPFAVWQVCVHGEDDGCECRKPRPGMVRRAAERLGVPVEACVVIGDTAADVGAAVAAGARGILVPNEQTRPDEIREAAEVAPDLAAAVDLALNGTASATPRARGGSSP